MLEFTEIDNNTYQIEATPDENWNGTETITVRVEDDQYDNYGTHTDTTFDIEVTYNEDEPTIEDIDDIETDEDVVAEVTISVTDPDTLYGDQLTFDCLIDEHAVCVANNDLTLLTIIPDQHFFGDSIFVELQVMDNAGNTDTTNFMMNVMSVNDPPQLSELLDDDIDEDTEKLINLNFISSDVDTLLDNEEELSFTFEANYMIFDEFGDLINNGPANNLLSHEDDNLIIDPLDDYNSDTDHNGIIDEYIEIVIHVEDNDGATDQEDFLLTVNSINDIPIITDIPNHEIDEDQEFCSDESIEDETLCEAENETWINGFTYTLSTSDIEDESETLDDFTIDINNNHADAYFIDKTLFINPIDNYFGVLDISISLTDSDGGVSLEEQFDLTVSSVNDGTPSLQPIIDQSMDEDTPISFDVVATDSLDHFDGFNGDITFTAVSSNSNITPTFIANEITIYPNLDWNGGPVEVMVTATDNDGSSASDLFEVIVAPINDNPTLNIDDITYQFNWGEPFTDENGDEDWTDAHCSDDLITDEDDCEAEGETWIDAEEYIDNDGNGMYDESNGYGAFLLLQPFADDVDNNLEDLMFSLISYDPHPNIQINFIADENSPGLDIQIDGDYNGSNPNPIEVTVGVEDGEIGDTVVENTFTLFIEDTILGCMDLLSCTYNSDATIPNDDVCLYNDCSGECDGNAYEDDCEICDDDPLNDNADKDCHGDCFGDALIDDCEVCSGGNTDHDANSDKDCNDVCNGTAFEDYCGVCSGGTTDHEADSDIDCNGLCFGPVDDSDNDGICDDVDPCIDVDDDAVCDDVDDCVGEYDECGDCNGDGIDEGACDCDGNVLDCEGVCDGDTVVDDCGICGGDGVDADDDGICDDIDDCVGEYDECGVCNGEDTSCIIITYPDVQNMIITIGDPLDIAWIGGNNADNIILQLFIIVDNTEELEITIGTEIENNGLYTWNVGEDILLGAKKIFIFQDADGNAEFDEGELNDYSVEFIIQEADGGFGGE